MGWLIQFCVYDSLRYSLRWVSQELLIMCIKRSNVNEVCDAIENNYVGIKWKKHNARSAINPNRVRRERILPDVA